MNGRPSLTPRWPQRECFILTARTQSQWTWWSLPSILYAWWTTLSCRHRYHNPIHHGKLMLGLVSSEHPNKMSLCPLQVASFPFKGNTSFLVILPTGNVSLVLPKLNISDLYSRLPQEKSMQVNVPKMKLQYRQELEEALTSMGEDKKPCGTSLVSYTGRLMPVKVFQD